jgi:GH25 family lysozyme M1 (1,4-beta-N-acetylmuramidase)
MGGIYASTSWFKDKLDLSKLKNYSTWVADYGPNNGKANKKPELPRVDAW